MGDETSPETELRTVMRRLISRCPNDYVQRHSAFLTMRHAFHEELAAGLRDALNRHLQDADCGDAASKRRLCSDTNYQLRELGLTISSDGRPAILVADVHDPNDDKGRFRLEIRDEPRGTIRTRYTRSMPEDLDLMEQPVRQEAFSRQYRERRRQPPSR